MPPFIVRDSPIQGKGVFASRDIKKGEVLGEMQGVEVDYVEYLKQYEAGNTRVSCDPFQVGVKTYITLDDPYNLINHNCSPNLGMKDERTIVALRDVRAGEELSFDYSATEWTPQDFPDYYAEGWPMKCECGSADCRTWVACFPYLPQEVQQAYVNSGVIQKHILEKLSWPQEAQRCLVCERELAKHKA